MILPKKLFDEYEVNFPVENELSIIIGANGSGKTQTLLALKEHFENLGENVLYFPTDRFFNLTKDEVTTAFVTQRLVDAGFDFFKQCDIDIDRELRYLPQPGALITSGFQQVLHMFCNIILLEQPTIILIDSIERSLHVGIQNIIIQEILKLENVKKLIVVTHSPNVIADYRSEVVDIIKCVNLCKGFTF